MLILVTETSNGNAFETILNHICSGFWDSILLYGDHCIDPSYSLLGENEEARNSYDKILGKFGVSFNGKEN